MAEAVHDEVELSAPSEGSVLADLISEVALSAEVWDAFLADTYVGWIHWAIVDDPSPAPRVKRIRPGWVTVDEHLEVLSAPSTD